MKAKTLNWNQCDTFISLGQLYDLERKIQRIKILIHKDWQKDCNTFCPFNEDMQSSPHNKQWTNKQLKHTGL